MGMQGAGKGTQAHLLEEYLKKSGEVFRFETGKNFRAFAEGEGYTAGLVRESLARGEVQPEFLSVMLWGGGFAREFTGAEHILIDGFPRSVRERELLSGALGFYKRLPARVLFLDITDEVAFLRMKERGRADDTDEAISERLRWYREQVSPIIDEYEKDSNYELVRVNGEQTVEAVHSDIVANL